MTQAVPPELRPVLIVDDSEDDFYATQRAFSKASIPNPIWHASSAQSALNRLQSETEPKPGLIMLDLNMPGTDGRQMLKIIKSDRRLKAIPVVVFTTSADERDIETCYRFGANTYIQKPVDFDGLIEALKCLKGYWFETAVLPSEILDPVSSSH
jgi:two-component system, response regulator